MQLAIREITASMVNEGLVPGSAKVYIENRPDCFIVYLNSELSRYFCGPVPSRAERDIRTALYESYSRWNTTSGGNQAMYYASLDKKQYLEMVRLTTTMTILQHLMEALNRGAIDEKMYCKLKNISLRER